MYGITFNQYYSSGTDEVAAIASNGEGILLKRKVGSFGSQLSVDFWTLKGGSLSNYNFLDTSKWTNDGADSTNWDNAVADLMTGLNQ